MAVTEIETEFSERKRRREEDNPEPLFSPEQGSSNNKKKRGKRKRKNTEPQEHPLDQVQLSPNPKPNPNPQVPQIGNVDTTTAQNPDLTGTPQKKKKRKKKKNKQVPIAQQPQTCDSSIHVEHHVPDPPPPEDGPQKKKRRRNKKKKVLVPHVAEPEQKESNNLEKGTVTEPKEAIAGNSVVSLKPELAPPSVEKREEPIETNVEHSRPCSKRESATTPINPKMKNDVELSEKYAEQRPRDYAAPESAMAIDTEQKEPITPIGQAPAAETATPSEQGQNMDKKKRRRKKKGVAMTITEGENPNECNVKPPEAPTGPVKRSNNGKSAVKSEELASQKHNAASTSRTPVQRTQGSSFTRAPFEKQRCQACQQLGHQFQNCRRLKSLSMNEEVCFFCGEIGHSLGKCSVTQAGGRRFAKCLFCYELGHFSFNCPKSGHRIVPKVCVDWSDKKSTQAVKFEISEPGWFYPEYMGLSEIFQIKLEK